jgi:hypothetical protein
MNERELRKMRVVLIVVGMYGKISFTEDRHAILVNFSMKDLFIISSGTKTVIKPIRYGPVGIAMTRALGDSVMTRAGVIPTPEITHLDLAKELEGYDYGSGSTCTVRIVIGSDGIFDVLKNEDANAQFSESGTSLRQGCEDLVNEARRKWKGGLPLDVRIDDTSVAVISFQYSN